jgi:hypothetical protein
MQARGIEKIVSAHIEEDDWSSKIVHRDAKLIVQKRDEGDKEQPNLKLNGVKSREKRQEIRSNRFLLISCERRLPVVSWRICGAVGSDE